MAYLTRDELYTHLYKNVVREINREDNLIEYPALSDFPVNADPDATYVAVDTQKYYRWVTVAYVEIVYSDNAVNAIKAATAEARGYLTAFDQDAIFNAEGDTRNPILLLYVKDITVWHYIQLANPSVDMQLRLDRYEKAIKWFEKVQAGKTNPDLPYKTVTAPDEPSNYMKWGSNLKRQNNF